jgi:hypothetical protein
MCKGERAGSIEKCNHKYIFIEGPQILQFKIKGLIENNFSKWKIELIEFSGQPQSYMRETMLH